MRTEHEVGCRALCLAALIARGRFEDYLERRAGSKERIAEMVADVQAWLEEGGLGASQSARERAVFAKGLGELTERERIDASWRPEALGVLLWALSVFEELPAYDALFSDKEELDAVGLYDFEPPEDFLARVRLRPAAQIADARDAAELWHWRARATGKAAMAPNIASAAAAAYQSGWAAPPIQGDFPAYGKAYAELSVEELQELHSIAGERHWAFNWLCGEGDSWDAVPLDT